MALFVGVFLVASTVSGQPAEATRAQPGGHRTADIVKFAAGAALALAAHEGGHLAFDLAFHARPRLTRVEFGGVPFFALTHRDDLSPRREFIVSSAGLWVQESWNEVVLTRRPGIRGEHAPITKGALAFNILTSVGYGVVAMAKAGPFERDTRGMAESVGLDERVIAAMVFAPALLDGYRYFKPDADWAAWTSRVAKAGSVALVVRSRE